MKHAQRPVSGMYVSQVYEPTDVNHQIRPLRRERGASVRLGLGGEGKGVPAGVMEAPSPVREAQP